jgi:HAMP domain-containing protein
MALHSATGFFDRKIARASLIQTLEKQRSRDWWFEGGRLYEVFLQRIYFGPQEDNVPLGVLVTGYALDDDFAVNVEGITATKVVLRYGDAVVASSLPPSQQQALLAVEGLAGGSSPLKPEEVLLGGEKFFAGSITLPPDGERPVTLTVLKSYDAAILFLNDVNRLVLGIGVLALITGSLLMFLISDTFTRPLSRLATGVVALEKGDFSYPLNIRRKDEIGELALAFDAMRKSLKESQQHLIQAERLATVGRMASTISHDLRHPLTTGACVCGASFRRQSERKAARGNVSADSLVCEQYGRVDWFASGVLQGAGSSSVVLWRLCGDVAGYDSVSEGKARVPEDTAHSPA